MLVRAFKLFARSTRAEGFWRLKFRLFRCYNSKLTYCKNFRKIGSFLGHFAGNLKSAKKERKSNTPFRKSISKITIHLVLLFTLHSFGWFWCYPDPNQCFLKWIRIWSGHWTGSGSSALLSIYFINYKSWYISVKDIRVIQLFMPLLYVTVCSWKLFS